MGFFGPMGPGGFRRRGRRRGLVVGAAAGAAVASRRSAKKQSAESQVADEDNSADMPDYTAQLTQLQKLKEQNLITDDEYEAKKKQVLGL